MLSVHTGLYTRLAGGANSEKQVPLAFAREGGGGNPRSMRMASDVLRVLELPDLTTVSMQVRLATKIRAATHTLCTLRIDESVGGLFRR